eukprot:11034293-Heterocapsa_arctica.AAC.1
MPTCQKAIEVSLILLMDSWRCGSQAGRLPRFCCPFHAAAKNLASAATRLKRMRCNASVKSTDSF